MSNLSVFDYKDYKAYLRDALRKKRKTLKGAQKRLAEALRCHPAYISQVLRADAHLSLEQTEDVNDFLGHAEAEAEFFLMLLQHQRAGTARLRKRIRSQMDRALERRALLKNRVGVSETLPIESQTRYYSAWYYAAVHIALSIPELQSREALSRYLSIPMPTLNTVLDFLRSAGLAAEEEGRLRIGTRKIFLGSDSPLISKHHTNWRMKAIQSLDSDLGEDLHFSTIMTVAKKDFAKARELLIRASSETRKFIHDSGEDTVCCLNMDFFALN